MVYNKPIRDLDDLKLEEQHFRDSPQKLVKLAPEAILSDVDAGQSLIAVFGEFVPTACLLVGLYNSLTLDVSIILRSPATPRSRPLGHAP